MPTYKITTPDGASYNVTAPDGASQEEVLAYAQSHHEQSSQPTQPTEPVRKSLVDRFKEQNAQGQENKSNMALGMLKGASDIGRTILLPFDKLGLSGYSPEARKQSIDQFFSENADTNSVPFKTGDITASIAGTAGIPGAIGTKVAKFAPSLGESIASGGLKTTIPANIATRVSGGAISGGAMAGLSNPDEVGTGAAIGAAIPVVGGIAGKVGKLVRGVAQPPELVTAIQEARNAGYVIPPTQANPTLGNRLLEGFSGKLTTAQNASAKNSKVTNALAAKSIGLPQDTTITPDILNSIRQNAGKAYEAVGKTGTISPSAKYIQKLDDIAKPYIQASQGFPNATPSPVLDLVESLKTPSFDAASAVEKIKMLRTAADDAFRSGNTDIARASKSASKILEDELESHLVKINSPDLLKNFRDARTLIAKTYTVEKALNPTTGTIDARKLGNMIKNKKPLSGELKQAGEFANRFPKAAQPVEGMGSLPQSSPLDWGASGLASLVSGNPLMMAGVAARPAARALTLSNITQNKLINKSTGNNRLADLLANPSVRALPVAIQSK